MDRISGPLHPRKVLSRWKPLNLLNTIDFSLWNVCNRNGIKLNVNCRKAKMLTVHAWSSSVRTLAIVQSSATLSISHFTSIKLQSLLLVFRHGSCTCIQIFRYRQNIEIFSFVIFRLWKFPLFFFFLSCNSLRKPTSFPRPPPPPSPFKAVIAETGSSCQICGWDKVGCAWWANWYRPCTVEHIEVLGITNDFLVIVKYPHCTPITPSRGTKLWKDVATIRAIGVPNIVQKRCQPPPGEVGGAKHKRHFHRTP